MAPSRKNERYVRGDLVWAKYGVHPFWPSLVASDDGLKIKFLFLPLDPDVKRHAQFSLTNRARNLGGRLTDRDRNAAGDFLNNATHELEEAYSEALKLLNKPTASRYPHSITTPKPASVSQTKKRPSVIHTTDSVETEEDRLARLEEEARNFMSSEDLYSKLKRRRESESPDKKPSGKLTGPPPSRKNSLSIKNSQESPSTNTKNEHLNEKKKTRTSKRDSESTAAPISPVENEQQEAIKQTESTEPEEEFIPLSKKKKAVLARKKENEAAKFLKSPRISDENKKELDPAPNLTELKEKKSETAVLPPKKRGRPKKLSESARSSTDHATDLQSTDPIQPHDDIPSKTKNISRLDESETTGEQSPAKKSETKSKWANEKRKLSTASATDKIDKKRKVSEWKEDKGEAKIAKRGRPKSRKDEEAKPEQELHREKKVTDQRRQKSKKNNKLDSESYSFRKRKTNTTDDPEHPVARSARREKRTQQKEAEVSKSKRSVTPAHDDSKGIFDRFRCSSGEPGSARKRNNSPRIAEESERATSSGAGRDTPPVGQQKDGAYHLVGGEDSDGELAQFPSFARLSQNSSLTGPSLLKSMEGVYTKGVVAWVKYRRYPVWPCVVTRYDAKKKKVSFEFLPLRQLPKKTSKYSAKVTAFEPYREEYFRNTKNMNDIEFLEAIRQADRIESGEMDPFDRKFYETVRPQTTAAAAPRKLKKISAKESKEPEFSDEEEWGRNSPSSDDLDDADWSGGSESGHKPKTSAPFTTPEEKTQDDDVSDSERSDASYEVARGRSRRKLKKGRGGRSSARLEQNKLGAAAVPEWELEVRGTSRSRSPRSQKIMNAIRSEETKEYLFKVYTHKVANDRQSQWEVHGTQTETVQGLQGVVHCDDLEQIMDMLSFWYQEVNPDDSFKKSYCYILAVWTPEAVKFALTKAFGLSMDEAEAQFWRNHSTFNPDDPTSPLPDHPSPRTSPDSSPERFYSPISRASTPDRERVPSGPDPDETQFCGGEKRVVIENMVVGNGPAAESANLVNGTAEENFGRVYSALDALAAPIGTAARARNISGTSGSDAFEALVAAACKERERFSPK